MKKKMELGDIVNINAPEGGYWKGKITEINYSYKHTFNDGEARSITYQKPIATVHETDGPSHATVVSSDLRREGNEWVEKKIGEE